MGPHRKQLFGADEDADVEAPVLQVNKEFASRFEHNKRREELHRLKEKYPEEAAKLERKALKEGMANAARRGKSVPQEETEEEEESSSEEEEDLGLISDKKEAQILGVLQKIQKKDPAVFDPNTKFFSESESDESEEEEEEKPKKKKEETKEEKKEEEKPKKKKEKKKEEKKEKKDKPMRLRDLIYKQAMEDGPEAVDSDEDAAPANQTYASEQQTAKKAFLEAFEEANDSAESIKVVRKHGVDSGARASAGPSTADMQRLLDDVFGKDGSAKPDEADAFLKRFIMNKGWVEAEEEEEAEEHDLGYEDEEQYLENAEEYEHSYNFRYEEPGGAQIITHPRQIEGSIRKEDDRRKQRRAERAARKATEKEERSVELRRLKNLKKEEVKSRLREIEAVAGTAAAHDKLLAALGDDDFDPEEYDRRMAEAYGDDYYEAEEEDPEALEAEYERQLEALAYGSDNDDEEQEDNTIVDHEGDEEEGEDQTTDRASLESRKAATFAELHKSLVTATAPGSSEETVARAREEVTRLLDEYYKLDYEGVAGGIKTRFRYKDVHPDSFGLESAEVLGMEDKELNRVVGLKLISAPYREDTWRLKPNLHALHKIKGEKAREVTGTKQKEKKRKEKASGDKQEKKKKKHKKDDAPAWEHGPLIEKEAGPSGANAVPVVSRPKKTPEVEQGAVPVAPRPQNTSEEKQGAVNPDPVAARPKKTPEEEQRAATYEPRKTLRKLKEEKRQAKLLERRKAKKDRKHEKHLKRQAQRKAERLAALDPKYAGMTKTQKKNAKRKAKRAATMAVKAELRAKAKAKAYALPKAKPDC